MPVNQNKNCQTTYSCPMNRKVTDETAIRRYIHDDASRYPSTFPSFCEQCHSLQRYYPTRFFLVKFHRVSQHRRSAQALSILGSSSAQLAHPLAQAAQVAQVLLSHLFLPLPQANHASWSHRRVMSFPVKFRRRYPGGPVYGLGAPNRSHLPKMTMRRLRPCWHCRWVFER
jgi:hypothetical protein